MATFACLITSPEGFQQDHWKHVSQKYLLSLFHSNAENQEGNSNRTKKESHCFHSALRGLYRCTLLLYKQILMPKSSPIRKLINIPFSRWLRICSRMAAKLLNSGEVSSIVSKQERSIRVLTENLEQKIWDNHKLYE